MRMALPLEPSCDSSRQKQNKEEPMPIEIKVAPPGITISQGRTFMVTNSGGEINPQTDEGVFAIDTRFISYYHLFINRVPWAWSIPANSVSTHRGRISQIPKSVRKMEILLKTR